MRFGLISSMALLTGAALAAPFDFAIENNHTDLVYRVGEKATFKVTAREIGGGVATSGTVTYVMDNFSGKKISQGKIDLAKTNPFVLEEKLEAPGFLCLRLNNPGTNATFWSVGYEPTAIRPGAKRPADFDAYWEGEMARLERDVPIDVKQEEMPTLSNAKVRQYRVSFATFDGKRVSGFLSVPRDASAAKRYGAHVTVPGAGPGANSCWGPADKVALTVNVHLFEAATNREEQVRRYKAQDEAMGKKYGKPRYSVAGINVSREEYFYHDVILGINRAVNWLAAREYVNAADIVYSGGSQGGAFGYFLCGLNTHFRKGVMYVSAMCDHRGDLAGRPCGWPQLKGNSDQKPETLARMPYFDAAFFASRITIPVRCTVGFADTTCPPSTTYSAFNMLGSKDKAILHGFGMKHSGFPEFYRRLGAWLNEK